MQLRVLQTRPSAVQLRRIKSEQRDSSFDAEQRDAVAVAFTCESEAQLEHREQKVSLTGRYSTRFLSRVCGHSDVQIMDLNDAPPSSAARLSTCVQAARRRRIRLSARHDVPQGCGRGPVCHGCVIRNSVARSLEGRTVSHQIVNCSFLMDSK